MKLYEVLKNLTFWFHFPLLQGGWHRYTFASVLIHFHWRIVSKSESRVRDIQIHEKKLGQPQWVSTCVTLKHKTKFPSPYLPCSCHFCHIPIFNWIWTTFKVYDQERIPKCIFEIVHFWIGDADAWCKLNLTVNFTFKLILMPSKNTSNVIQLCYGIKSQSLIKWTFMASWGRKGNFIQLMEQIKKLIAWRMWVSIDKNRVFAFVVSLLVFHMFLSNEM